MKKKKRLFPYDGTAKEQLHNTHVQLAKRLGLHHAGSKKWKSIEQYIKTQTQA
ncbi:MAG: hypothetical protein IJR13_07685 [Bacteroidales bacterium]|nr:hypothetical protein [Bacteroidales bacterium]